jgi:DNA-3-methyladenine glycosylase II
MLGLDIDLTPFHQFAASDPHLGPLASRFHGFKPPRYVTLFEALLNGIACQQVTLNLGIQLLNRLAATCGVAVSGLHALPLPEALVDQDPQVLRNLGFSQQKARAMIELARATVEGKLTIEELTALESGAAVSRLCQFRGIGRWTAEYVLLRGLGRLDVFPSGDSGARNSLQRWLGLPETLDDAGIQRTLDQWRSYAGLIYLHLLLRGLAEAESF